MKNENKSNPVGVNTFLKVRIDEDRCKGCLLCVSACPKNLLKPSKKINKFGYNPVEFTNNDLCTSCTLCAISCPDVAITVYK